MKLHLISDIHLEFECYQPECKDADLVILAGDIGVGQKGILWAREHFTESQVLYVMGNHEFYNHAYPVLIDELRSLTQDSHVHLLENDIFIHQGIAFYGCALWSDFNILQQKNLAILTSQKRMNDFRLIHKLPSHNILTPKDVLKTHQKSVHWLSKNFQNKRHDKNVIITHHAPSIQSIPPQYRDHILTGAFASNLEGFIENFQPDVWIHGHIHDTYDYIIHKTRVLCNPKGYPHQKNETFNPNLIIEL